MRAFEMQATLWTDWFCQTLSINDKIIDKLTKKAFGVLVKIAK